MTAFEISEAARGDSAGAPAAPRASAFRLAHSLATDPRQAAAEFHAGVSQPEMALVIFFCSHEYDREMLAAELNRLFGPVPVIGCTTAGEIGEAGYRGRSISGVSFAAGVAHIACDRLDALHDFQAGTAHAFAQNLLNRLENTAPEACADNTFAFLLIDGMSMREESTVFALHTVLRDIPLCGGSAGNGLNFGQTWIFHDGAFHTDCALLLLVSTALPFRLFMTQHFVRDNERMVVTAADATRRIVHELNGRPAATEYARVLGLGNQKLYPDLFARTPVVVLINGTHYVRSIQKANPDGSLTFFCAIEEGLVLRVAHGTDLTANLAQAFARVREAIGPPQLTLGCDCILRKLEIFECGLAGPVGNLLKANRTAGFATYGEQYGGVHVNQTFTGIAIGYPEAHHDAPLA